MKWTDLRDTFEKVGLPILAQAIPGGGIVATLVKGALGLASSAGPEEVKAAMTPENVLKLTELQNTHAEVMAKAAYDAQTADRQAERDELVAVNTTMQTEAKAEHWLQWSWRPLNGYTLAVGSLALVLGTIYLAVVAVANKDFSTLNAIPTVVMAVTAALAVPGAVCGVTAWHRGVAQRIDAGEERVVKTS